MPQATWNDGFALWDSALISWSGDLWMKGTLREKSIFSRIANPMPFVRIQPVHAFARIEEPRHFVRL